MPFGSGGKPTAYPIPADSPSDMQNERNAQLDRIAGVGDVLAYEYDLGDGWEHEVRIEKALAADPAVRYPRCTAGKRACPPENCGGPPGYEHLLEALRDPKREEHEELRKWIGADFDPAAFDLGVVNKLLWRTK